LLLQKSTASKQAARESRRDQRNTHTHTRESWREGKNKRVHSTHRRRRRGRQAGRRDGRSWFRQYSSGRESDRIVQEGRQRGTEGAGRGDYKHTHTHTDSSAGMESSPGIMGVFPPASRLFFSLLFYPLLNEPGMAGWWAWHPSLNPKFMDQLTRLYLLLGTYLFIYFIKFIYFIFK
jgi:hypothetical protein